MTINQLFLSSLSAFLLFFNAASFGASSSGEEIVAASASALVSSSSSSVPASGSVELRFNKPFTLDLLSKLPAGLASVLKDDLSGGRLMVFLDFDDMLAQREFDIGRGFHFKYLSSPEINRQLSPFTASIIKERTGGDVPRTKFANDAIAYTFKTYFTDKALSYRYPEEVPFKEGILEVLQKMGAVVKICSGLPLAGAKKIAFVESLGLTAADYIFAGKKAEGISQFIAADYAAQKQAGGEVNQTYVAVLMDNLGGAAQSHQSSAIDKFIPQMVAAAAVLPAGVRVVPLPIYSTRFDTELNRDKGQIAQEIDWAMQLKERDQKAQEALVQEAQLRAQEEAAKAAEDRLAAQLREQAQRVQEAMAKEAQSLVGFKVDDKEGKKPDIVEQT